MIWMGVLAMMLAGVAMAEVRVEVDSPLFSKPVVMVGETTARGMGEIELGCPDGSVMRMPMMIEARQRDVNSWQITIVEDTASDLAGMCAMEARSMIGFVDTVVDGPTGRDGVRVRPGDGSVQIESVFFDVWIQEQPRLTPE